MIWQYFTFCHVFRRSKSIHAFGYIKHRPYWPKKKKKGEKRGKKMHKQEITVLSTNRRRPEPVVVHM